MCPLTAMYVCRYGIALYTHGCTQPLGRGSNLVYMHHIRQERTQERGLQVRPAIRKAEGGGGGGGGGGLLYASGPLSTPVWYTYSMVKATSLWGEDPSTPHLPPLRRIRHVVTQWYVLLFLIVCAYGLAVTTLNKSKARQR